MDRLARKNALASKRTYFSESRPTLTDIQHLFPTKSEEVLAKEAGTRKGKGPVVTRAFRSFSGVHVQWGLPRIAHGRRGFPTHTRRRGCFSHRFASCATLARPGLRWGLSPLDPSNPVPPLPFPRAPPP
jgi:hypothetical protein